MSDQHQCGNKLLGNWVRPQVTNGARHALLWFMPPVQKGEYELSIQSLSPNTTKEPYPQFPFYAVVVIEKEGKKYLSPADDEERRKVSEANGLGDIPFHCDGDRLVIGSNSMRFQHGRGTVEVNLAGVYTRDVRE